MTNPVFTGDGEDIAPPIIQISSKRKKCSVCNTNETNYKLKAENMTWRECFSCMPTKHRNLLSELYTEEMRIDEWRNFLGER